MIEVSTWKFASWFHFLPAYGTVVIIGCKFFLGSHRESVTVTQRLSLYMYFLLVVQTVQSIWKELDAQNPSSSGSSTSQYTTSFRYIAKVYFWFKYDSGQKYYASQVQPDRGSNSWPPDHDRTFNTWDNLLGLSLYWQNYMGFPHLKYIYFTYLASILLTTRR